MKIIRQILIASILTVTLLSFGGSLRVAAQTDPFSEACKKLDGQQKLESEACNPTITGSDPIGGQSGILADVANIVALVAGAAAVIVIIISGYQFVFSGGDAAKVASARNTIIYAVVGIILIAVARGIVAFVVSEL